MFEWRPIEDRFAIEDEEQDKLVTHEAAGSKGHYSVFDPSGDGTFHVFYADARKEKHYGSDIARVKIGAYASLEGAKRIAQEHEARLKQPVLTADR